MGVPTTQAVNLPAHLVNFGNFGLNEAITGGLKTGGHPRIAIKGSKWRLQEGASEEVLNTLTMDVIIVDANKTMSKVYYMGKYNPNETEYKAPDCFSDNGVGPSTQAGSPQNQVCATCPHNVWGSKVNEMGNKTKACADYKKIAVVLADDPQRNVFELRVPGASLQDLNKIMSRLINNRVPIPALVFELSFDPAVDYPKIMFKPTRYVSEEEAALTEKWLGSADAKDAVGANDVAIAAGVPLTHQAPSHQVASHPAPAQVAQPPKPAPKPEFDPLAPQPQPVAAQEAPAKRGRGRPAASQGKPQPVEQQLTMDLPGVQAAEKAVPINPQMTDAGLDALLADVLK